MASKKKRAAPWDRPAPKKVQKRGSKPLTTAQKKHAAARAKRAGRSYPNLVDNMQEAQQGGRKRSAKKATKKSAAKKRTPRKSAAKKRTPRKSAAKKRTPRKSAAKKSAAKQTSRRKKATRGSREKDPRGGLTAAGRRAFHERDGSNLKPGVKKRVSEMSREEMKRKGSWAVRFYGRKQLPKLLDADGKPTRFALSARAWGEPVPRTETAAREIAAKGQRLLERARR